MAQVVLGKAGDFTVRFVKEKEQLEAWGYSQVKGIYEPEYLNAFFLPEEEGKGVLFMGLGEEDPKRAGAAKELGAACCKEMKKLKITSFTICLGDLYEENPEREVLIGWSGGIYLATEAAATYKTDREVTEYTVGLEGLEASAACYLEDGHTLAESVLFARDMTNMPANYLYPEKFAEKICAFVEDTGIETQVLHREDLQEKRMGGILGVGKGSEYAPCMVILRYRGDQNTKEITGLVGKGVTGMYDITVISIIVACIVSLVREYGGIQFILNLIKSRIRGRRGGEFGIAVLALFVDLCTANNTIAIVMAGPIAKEISEEYDIDPKRSASLLDIFTSVGQGMIPYGAQLLSAATLTGLTPFDIIPNLFYPILMGVSAILFIVFKKQN